MKRKKAKYRAFQKDIIALLRRKNGLSVGEIAEELKSDNKKSLICHHLDKLKDKGEVVKKRQGANYPKYYLSEKTDVKKQVMRAICKAIGEERKVHHRYGLDLEEIEELNEIQHLDRDIIRETISSLFAHDELRVDFENELLFPSPGAMGELEFCYYCGKKIEESPRIIAMVREKTDGGEISVVPVLICRECYPKMRNIHYGFTGSSYRLSKKCFCSFCGLPLVPIFDLPEKRKIRCEEIDYCFNKLERKVWEKNKEESLSFPRKEEVFSPFDFDLHNLADVEEFVDKIVNYAKKTNIPLDNYNKEERKKEIWKEAVAYCERKKKKLEEAYKELLTPMGKAHLTEETSWTWERSFNPEAGGFVYAPPSDFKKVGARKWTFSFFNVTRYAGGKQTLVEIRDGKTMHPRCARAYDEQKEKEKAKKEE